MKYMMIVKLDGASETRRNYEAGIPPDAKLEGAMGKLMEEMAQVLSLIHI